MSPTFDKQHATTVVLTAAVAANRLISFAGAYASGAIGAGGLADAQGVSEFGGEIGQAISVVTGYSYLVEAGETIEPGDFIKPGTNGRAAVGDITDHCGRAVSGAGEGKLFEAILLPHVHPAEEEDPG